VKYLLDTDHISVLQQHSGPEYAALSARIALHPPTDLALSAGWQGLRDATPVFGRRGCGTQPLPPAREAELLQVVYGTVPAPGAGPVLSKIRDCPSSGSPRMTPRR
jgi:hypothetical protein